MRKWVKFEKNPVLKVGDPNSWESYYVRDPWMCYENGKYRMWYWGDNDIGYAESSDGINWSKYEGNPILKNAGRPWIVKADNKFFLYHYTPEGKIGLAISENPLGPFLERKIVLEPTEEWEGGHLMCVSVIKEDGIWKMWYSANIIKTFNDIREPKFVGYATSKSGFEWEKYQGNPIIRPSEKIPWLGRGICSLNVFKIKEKYCSFFNAISDADGRSRIGYIESPDGINWPIEKSELVIDVGKPGDFDENHSYRPFPIFTPKKIHLWYNGQNKKGIEEIGYAYTE